MKEKKRSEFFVCPRSLFVSLFLSLPLSPFFKNTIKNKKNCDAPRKPRPSPRSCPERSECTSFDAGTDFVKSSRPPAPPTTEAAASGTRAPPASRSVATARARPCRPTTRGARSTNGGCWSRWRPGSARAKLKPHRNKRARPAWPGPRPSGEAPGRSGPRLRPGRPRGGGPGGGRGRRLEREKWGEGCVGVGGGG